MSRKARLAHAAPVGLVGIGLLRQARRGVNSAGAFDRILASLYRATRDDDHWPATAALIDEACGAVGNTLLGRLSTVTEI